jgi:predicted GNAT family acetyltransferase
VHVVAGTFAADRSRTAFERTYATVDSVCWPGIAAVVAYTDDEPVASAIVYVSHGVGCITWVGTLPAARRRGHATYCTMAASARGFGMGADAVAGPATDVGARVYEKLGAQGTTRHRWYRWTPA